MCSFSLASTSMNAPGSIEVIASATDDVSGVNSINVTYRCKETEKSIYGYLTSTYWDSDFGDYVPYPDGKMHGFIEADKYLESGEFLLDNIRVMDKAGNTQWYEDIPYEDELPFRRMHLMQLPEQTKP